MELNEETKDFLLRRSDCTFHVRQEMVKLFTVSFSVLRGGGGVFDSLCHFFVAGFLTTFENAKKEEKKELCNQCKNN